MNVDTHDARTGSDPPPAVVAVPLVVFLLEGQRYALALPSVQRALRVVAITPLPKAPAIVLGVVDLGGEVMPAIDMRCRFNHPRRDLRLSDHLIVARAGTRTVALVVDETSGIIEPSSGSIVAAGEILPMLDLVDGAIKLEDGLVLIHDLERLLSLDEGAALDAALVAAQDPAHDPVAGRPSRKAAARGRRRTPAHGEG